MTVKIAPFWLEFVRLIRVGRKVGCEYHVCSLVNDGLETSRSAAGEASISPTVDVKITLPETACSFEIQLHPAAVAAAARAVPHFVWLCKLPKWRKVETKGNDCSLCALTSKYTSEICSAGAACLFSTSRPLFIVDHPPQ